jgi:HPt (histidine-containing phosphotransfer) domain-containing protein
VVSASNSNAFDYGGSLKRMGNDCELFEEMAGLLREDAPPLLGKLHQALARRDFDNIRLAAHSLKGQATNFGAQRAVQAAANVECAARDRREQDLPPAVGELDAALE